MVFGPDGEIFKGLRGGFRGTLGADLGVLMEDGAVTLTGLEAVMKRLGVEKDYLNQAAGWSAEKVSRTKLNEHLTGSPELTRLLEVETLSLGVAGKRALWQALRVSVDQLAPLTVEELDVLISRAERQFEGLEEKRLECASTLWTAMNSSNGSAQNQ